MFERHFMDCFTNKRPSGFRWHGLALTTAIMLGSTPVTAQTVLSGPHSVDGALCVGEDCTSSEAFLGSDLMIKSVYPWIRLEDSNSGGGASSSRDWSIRANDTTEDFFAIVDEISGNQNFRLEANAPANALFVAASGAIGLGTNLPANSLHILTQNTNIGLTLEQTVSNNNWSITTGGDGFFIKENTTSNLIASFEKGAPENSLSVKQNGNIGLGTYTPDAPLELSSANNFNFFRITALGAPINDSVDIVFTKGPLNTGQLRYNIVEAADSPQVAEMTLDADGNMVLTGSLITSGPTCTTGCDRVFDEGYGLKTIEEHQAQMWSAGYLPNIGPTVQSAPFNVSDKMGRMLNELEHAHIYIGQLHNRVEAQDTLNTTLLDRLAALESILAER